MRDIHLFKKKKFNKNLIIKKFNSQSGGKKFNNKKIDKKFPLISIITIVYNNSLRKLN